MKKCITFFSIYFFVLINIYPQNNDEFYLKTIDEEFIGVYLPVEYIDSLNVTKNHSISMHLNDKSKYHDVLSVNKNIIYSNLKFHDRYAIRAIEGNIFQFLKNEGDAIIIDNNGYSYKRIGIEPTKDNSIVQTFVGKIVFEKLLEKGIVILMSDGIVSIPFLYFFTDQDTFSININDQFFDKGINILLYNQSDHSYLGMVIDGENNLFYRFSESGDINKKTNLIFNLNINENKILIYALTGITENVAIDDVQFLDNLTEYEKRELINTMFALNGYSFATEQWKTFFNKYSWYKPNNKVKNDPSILNIRQKRLLDYLSQ